MKPSLLFQIPTQLLHLSPVLILCLLLAAKTIPASAAEALADGSYAIEVALSGGSGKAAIESPTLMKAKDGQYYAQITWSSPNYDYMIVNHTTYYPQNEGNGNSRFLIPIPAFDEDIPVIADTLAMGTPHEISYTLHFYSDSIDSESSLPQEGAKRVLAMAACIIVIGGILNHFSVKRRNMDYLPGETKSP